MFLMGGVFSAQFGMSAVYGSLAGLSVAQISTFVATIYIGGLILQYPIGYLSDRMDRRRLIMFNRCSRGHRGNSWGGPSKEILQSSLWRVSLSVVWRTRFMPFCWPTPTTTLNMKIWPQPSGGMVFINGVGAISGPVIVGWMMGLIGPVGFWVYLTFLMLLLAGYSLWRMTQRPSIPVDETSSYTPVLPSASPVAVELAQEFDIETAQEEERIDRNRTISCLPSLNGFVTVRLVWRENAADNDGAGRMTYP